MTQQLDPQYLAAAEQLAARPYGVLVDVELLSTGKPVYVARIPELPGCMGQGITEQEAVADVKAAAVVYIQSLLADGLEVPKPDSKYDLEPVSAEVEVYWQTHPELKRIDPHVYSEDFIIPVVRLSRQLSLEFGVWYFFEYDSEWTHGDVCNAIRSHYDGMARSLVTRNPTHEFDTLYEIVVQPVRDVYVVTIPVFPDFKIVKSEENSGRRVAMKLMVKRVAWLLEQGAELPEGDAE